MRPLVAHAASCALATVLVAGARADVVPLDMAGVFNADLVVNDGTGALDPTQDPVDLGLMASDNFCFPTQSVAVRLAAGFSPDGLPDDAVFPTTPDHPDLQLWWRNDDDGLNARRSPGLDAYAIPVAPDTYAEVHLFATSGDGDSLVTVTLGYLDGSIASTSFVVPDWYQAPFGAPDVYFLIDGRDRLQVGSGPGLPYDYESADTAAIFGLRLAADPAKTLSGLTVERTDASGVLDLFGAVAVTADPPRLPDLYESTLAPGMLVPANIVRSGVTSPVIHGPPAAPLLFYQVDDGAGAPALVFVAKAGADLRVTF